MKSKTSLVFVLIIYKIIFSQTLIYPTFPTDKVTDVTMLGEGEIVLINEGGSIFKSYDSGTTWTLKKHFQGCSLKEMKFLNDQTGFVIPEWRNIESNEGIIYTTDGGEIWSSHNINVYDAITFMPLSESVMLKSTWDGVILRLDNFYGVWDTTYQMPVYVEDYGELGEVEISYGDIVKFEVLPSGRVLALCVNDQADFLDDSLTFVLKSDDLGLTWETIWQGLTFIASDMSFANNETGWIGANKNIARTSDGGYSWEVAAFSELNYDIKQIFTVDENNLFAKTYGSSIQQYLISNDSGDSWTTIIIDSISGEFEFYFANATEGYLYGDDLFRTIDGGRNWIRIDKSLKDRIFNVEFISTLEGFANGYEGLYRTHDGGNTWTLSFVFPGGGANIEMTNDSIGWLKNYYYLFKTIDGGENWQEVSLPLSTGYGGGMSFYDDKFGIIHSKYEGDIYAHYITFNGGSSWSRRAKDKTLAEARFDNIQIVDPEHIYGINRVGLWLSEDTVKSWRKIYDPEDRFYGTYAFNFYDLNHGLLIASYFDGLFTVDGGQTWHRYSKPVGTGTADCIILGPDAHSDYRTLEIGSDGTMIQCHFNPDGIITFTNVLPTFTKNNLYEIEVFMENQIAKVWIVGDGFTVLNGSFGRIYTAVDFSLSHPKHFNLEQNYPNPFNSGTVIPYFIEEPNHVRLVIYNILGEKIRNLIDEFQQTGYHRINFDGSKLPSGLYFYTIRSGKYADSKKMILMR